MMSITDINEKKPPVIYSVKIAQHWDGRLEYFLEDISPDERSLLSVAWALKEMAKALERDATPTAPEPSAPADKADAVTESWKPKAIQGPRRAVFYGGNANEHLNPLVVLISAEDFEKCCRLAEGKPL